jgi:hypothetical protein
MQQTANAVFYLQISGHRCFVRYICIEVQGGSIKANSVCLLATWGILVPAL